MVKGEVFNTGKKPGRRGTVAVAASLKRFPDTKGESFRNLATWLLEISSVLRLPNVHGGD
jgi:hypothetical protein